jgi:beta-barrel assembly-enhancing protease
MIHRLSSRRVGAAVLALTVASAAPAAAVNLFSAQQDVQVGRQAAAEAERQLPMLRDSQVEGYVNAIVRRLAGSAPGPRFPYQAKVVNAADINAFALPGGYMYVNRGLIEAVRSEAELAGVLAHEMAHVAERHGTEQATKAYGAQAGLGILGQLLAGRDRKLGTVEQIVGAVGVNALFMKFSRNAENEADRVGAQMMARAGYDPMAMASFFDLLHAQRGKNPNAVAQFFSSHPAPANRSANIRAYSKQLGRGNGARVGNLSAVQARLDRAPAARRQATLRASQLRRRR